MADVNLNVDEWEKMAAAIADAANPREVDALKVRIVKQLGAVYLARAKRLTPVGARGTVTMKNGRKLKIKTEHMRRAWDAGDVERARLSTSVRISNSASYASFVNDGHRQQPGRFVPILGKRLVANFVEGLHIAEAAQAEVEAKAKGIAERESGRWARRLKNGGD